MDSRIALLNARPLVRRLIMLSLPLVALALVAMSAFTLWHVTQTLSATISERRAELGRLTAIAAMRPSDSPATTHQDIVADYLPGGSDALVQAALQSRLHDLVGPSGADVRAVANMPITDRAGQRYVGLRVTMAGSNAQIIDAVHAIEVTRPYLTIRKAQITTDTNAPQTRLSPQMLVLQIEFEGATLPQGIQPGKDSK